MSLYDKAKQTADFIKSKINNIPKTAIVLGSGLGPFAKEIEKRIGVQTDTTAIDKELANYESKLKEVDLNKARLEREIDNLPIDARFRERKIHDMTLRLDALYDTIVELEERIEDAKLRRTTRFRECFCMPRLMKRYIRIMCIR